MGNLALPTGKKVIKMSKNIKKKKYLKDFDKFDKVKKKRVITELLVLESLSNIRVLLAMVCDNLLSVLESEGLDIEDIKDDTRKSKQKFSKSSKVDTKS